MHWVSGPCSKTDSRIYLSREFCQMLFIWLDTGLAWPSLALMSCLVPTFHLCFCAQRCHVFHNLLTKGAGFPAFGDDSYDLKVFVGSSIFPTVFRRNNFIFPGVFVLDRREGRRWNQDSPNARHFPCDCCSSHKLGCRW